MNVFDPSIFDVNPDCVVNISDIGNLYSRFITVDDFFLYPEKILEFAETFPLQDNISKDPNEIKGFYPGYQNYFVYNVKQLWDFVRYHAETIFGTQIRGLHTAYQCIDGSKKVYAQCNHPHTDSGLIAGNIFLSDTVEKGSGTRFYRHRETGEEATFANNCKYRRERYGSAYPNLELVDFEPVIEDQNFISYHLAEEKFNRLNMYEGALFHSAFIEKGTYKNHLRKSISFLTQS